MEKFIKLKSIPAHIPLMNIDTDMIIPKQFLKTIKRTGLGKSLFYEMRYDESGKLIDKFILNNDPYSKSKILLTGKNFGCGSSREHAPWALLDFGIRCVIAPSFADIFYNNCFKNGILPIVLDEKKIEEIVQYYERKEQVEINLENQEILFGNKLNNSFLIPDIGYTLGYSYTPSHKESQYFDWDDRHVLNISAALSDEYTFFQSDKRNFSLGWILDYRTLANNDDQNYLINGTSTFYDQDDELKKEASFSSNLNYKYKPNENSIFSFNLDGLTSSQDSVSLLANLIFKFKI